MTLKRQLFIASLLMLIIPWAGLQFVLELDTALRQQASTQLEQQAGRLANLIDVPVNGEARTPRRPVTYAPTINHPLALDGSGYDWPGYDEERQQQLWQGSHPLADGTRQGSASLNWRVAVHENNLYLLVRINNRNQGFYDPARPERPFDELRIFLEQPQGVIEHRVPSLARGNVDGFIPGRDNRQDFWFRGMWEPTGDNGHQLELRLPRPEQGATFGFQLTGPVYPTDHQQVLSEHINTRLISRQASMEQQLAQLLAPGQNAWILEPEGWVVAHRQQPANQQTPDFDSLTPAQILERISLNALRALVRLYQPEPIPVEDQARQFKPDQLPEQGLVRHTNGDLYLLATKAFTDGRKLVLEESLDQMLTLSGSTLGSVITRSALLLITLMLVLLGYASWLSWRITRLQRAVSASIDEDGRLLRTLPPVKAKDELGDLSRQFTHLTERLHGYTHYLESFSRRLSHELKTPIAVVRSSLENLSHSTSDKDSENYLARARTATDRLSQILHGMSEAARLEQSLDHAEKETFDLADVCVQTTEAYQSLAPDFRIRYQGPQHGVRYHGSPELLVQLLDKLVDNARDFTPEGGLIEIGLRRESENLLLSVFNQGSALPEELARDIFSPFVSIRSAGHEGHLGQGLLIARLIAEHHRGRIQAGNENGGVRFTVALPDC